MNRPPPPRRPVGGKTAYRVAAFLVFCSVLFASAGAGVTAAPRPLDVAAETWGWEQIEPDLRLNAAAAFFAPLLGWEAERLRFRRARAETVTLPRIALAFPDGTVVLTAPLLEAVAGDSDLLRYILAHEAAHVILRHSEAEESMADAWNESVEELGRLSVLLEQPEERESRDPMDRRKRMLSLLLERGRAHLKASQETQADAFAARLLIRAGYRINVIKEIFDRLEETRIHSSGQQRHFDVAQEERLWRRRREAMIKTFENIGVTEETPMTPVMPKTGRRLEKKVSVQPSAVSFQQRSDN